MRLSDAPKSRLLRTVGGRPHANNEDHYETAGSENQSSSFILAEPVSSDVEEPVPPPIEPPKPQSSTTGSRRNNRKAFITPRPGAWQHNEELKAQKSSQEQGQGSAGSSFEMTGSRMSREDAGETVFGMEFGSTRPRKKKKVATTFTTARTKLEPTQNVHKVEEKPKTKGYGKAADELADLKSRLKRKAACTSTMDFTSDSDGAGSSPKPKTSVSSRTKPLQPTKNKHNSSTVPSSGLATPDSTDPGSKTLRRKGVCASQNSSKSTTSIDSESAKENVKEEGLLAKFKRKKPNRFQRPTLEPFSDSDDESPLSSPPASPKQDPVPEILPEPDVPRCQLCEEEVEEEHLYEFTRAHGKMTFKNQRTFCHEHKKRKAEKEYAARGYPTIEWDMLSSRIRKHWPRLEAVVTGNATSHYRKQHQEKVVKGAQRTAKQAFHQDESGIAPSGYYGSKGARAMMEAITDSFAPQIREHAPKDKVVSYGGISNFVQAVLVPELAMMLVMEDMEVEEDEAIDIISDSVWIGELMHEEDDDAVGAQRSENTVSAFASQWKYAEDSGEEENLD